MGIWAGIKYALNSTLGTSDFISLDKLINSKVKRYTASTDTISTKTYTGTTSNLKPQVIRNTLLASFYLPYDGVIYINASLTNKSGISGGENYGYYILYIGNIDNPIFASSETSNNISISNIKIPIKAYETINVWSSVSLWSRDSTSTDTVRGDVGTTSATITLQGKVITD